MLENKLRNMKAKVGTLLLSAGLALGSYAVSGCGYEDDNSGEYNYDLLWDCGCDIYGDGYYGTYDTEMISDPSITLADAISHAESECVSVAYNSGVTNPECDCYCYSERSDGVESNW